DRTGQVMSNGRGVFIKASDNLVGGTAVGAGNTIAYNGGAAVEVVDGFHNAILSNVMYSNSGLGIGWANNLGAPEAPVLGGVTGSSVEGDITGQAGATYRVQFFTGGRKGFSRYPQGDQLAGTTLGTGGGNG